MSGGEGLRALGCFPLPAATQPRGPTLGRPARGKAAARAFPSGSREVLGQQVFLWIAALD